MAKITIDIPDYTISENEHGEKTYHIRETIGNDYSPNYRCNPFDVSVDTDGDITFIDPESGKVFFIYADQAKVLAELNLFQRT